MKWIFSFSFLAFVTVLGAEVPSVRDIINRARATVGTEAALDGLVTLQITGAIVPADSNLPDAMILIVTRKPCSQRLEVRMGDVVETTILEEKRGVVIRTDLNEKASRMRPLTDQETDRVASSTRQFFSFFRPDFKNGEQVSYEGLTQHRGERAHKLVYTYPDGVTTTRFFSLTDDTLIATLSDKGLETVEVGEQTVGGIKFPKRIESYEGERLLHSLVLNVIEVNRPLEAGIFKIPGSQ